MTRTRCRGSVLALCLVMMLVVFALAGSLLAVAAARCGSIARESRRAQALALAESAAAVAQAKLTAGQPPSPVAGSLSTGRYSATIVSSGPGRIVVKAVGDPRPLVGGPVSVAIETTLTRRGERWQVAAWREVGR
jgi:type II secretory pathway pseudopilin PulG